MNQAPNVNPFLCFNGPIQFDRMRADFVRPALEQLLMEAERELESIVGDDAQSTFESVIGAMENATSRLEDSLGWVSHLVNLIDDRQFRDVYNEMQPRVAEFFSGIPHRQNLWDALSNLSGIAGSHRLTEEQQRSLDSTTENFKRQGAALDAAAKIKLTKIDLALATETNRFTENVVYAADQFELLVTDESRLAGLPESEIEAARTSAERKNKEGWRFTLQGPSYLAAMTYLEDSGLRETLYRAYNSRATDTPYDNTERMATILNLRAEKAQMLGYGDVADLYLENRMVKSGQSAQDFVDGLIQRTRPSADREHTELMAFAAKEFGVQSMEAWDLSFYAEKQRRQEFGFDEEVLRPYLGLTSVLDGLYDLLKRLYGVTIEQLPEQPTWHPDVTAYSLNGEAGQPIGIFYLDLFPREGKRGGAWMQPLRLGDSGQAEPHVGVVCCNFSKPIGAQPALLRHRELETLFHEFGHLMHHLLTQVSVRGLAGCNVAWDFVELPSQIMENWCWEKEGLNLVARHYETGLPIPDALFEKLINARNFRTATGMMRQLSFGAVDLALHRVYDPGTDGSVVEFSSKVASDFFPIPLPSDYAQIASFRHLFGGPIAYAAGYYSYKWAEVLEADAFSRFKNEGLFSASVGDAFRRTILSKGNSKDPMVLYTDFMGRHPDPDALFERAGLA